jgi:hypothetical protein
MKTRYKIVIISVVFFVAYVSLTSSTTCVFTSEQYEWLGSNNGCGPTITLEMQRFFEKLFS